jgi:hypothetical protein
MLYCAKRRVVPDKRGNSSFKVLEAVTGKVDSGTPGVRLDQSGSNNLRAML